MIRQLFYYMFPTFISRLEVYINLSNRVIEQKLLQFEEEKEKEYLKGRTEVFFEFKDEIELVKRETKSEVIKQYEPYFHKYHTLREYLYKYNQHVLFTYEDYYLKKNIKPREYKGYSLETQNRYINSQLKLEL